MAQPIHIDAPLDYKELWISLKERLIQVVDQQAITAATSKDEWHIRRAQGGYEMARRVLVEMQSLVDAARGAESVYSDTEH